MPWDNNPEGQQRSLPDLPEIIKKVGDSLSLGKGRKPLWLIVIVIVLAIILAYTAFYTIPPGHQGIVLRFGRYSGMVLPGLHFKIPFGVDTVFKVHTEQVDTESFGFKSVRPGIRTQYEKSAATERESLMLTGDLNVIDVEWIIQFRSRRIRRLS